MTRLFFIFAFLVAQASAFRLATTPHGARSSTMRMSIASSFPLAELFSGPAAKYNGELIDKSLKLVEAVPKPAGYEYGAVSDSGTPALGLALILVVAAAAAVPYFLSIGESAQSQQREREAVDKTVNNRFAKQNVNAARSKQGVVVGVKRSAGSANVKTAAPAKAAAAPAKTSSIPSFGAKKSAAPAPAKSTPVKPASPAKASSFSMPSFGGAKKISAPAPAIKSAAKASVLSFGSSKTAAPAKAAPAPVKKGATASPVRKSAIPVFGK